MVFFVVDTYSVLRTGNRELSIRFLRIRVVFRCKVDVSASSELDSSGRTNLLKLEYLIQLRYLVGKIPVAWANTSQSAEEVMFWNRLKTLAPLT
jgi:hypothetical protein